MLTKLSNDSTSLRHWLNIMLCGCCEVSDVRGVAYVCLQKGWYARMYLPSVASRIFAGGQANGTQLCDNCNYARLHNGLTKQQVYLEKSKGKKMVEKQMPDVKQLKKKFSINKISTANKYTCSDGTKVTQAEINRNYAEVCDKIKQEREPCCEGCGRYDRPLSFSHTISRQQCKDLGMAELIWDKGNIEIECFHEPSSDPTACHNIWEVAPLEVKKKLFNFEKKVKYMESKGVKDMASA